MSRPRPMGNRCLSFVCLFLIFGFLYCVATKAYASERDYAKQRLAVLIFDTKNLDAGTVQAVTEYTQSCFENSRLYIVVERNKIEQVLHEQSFQLSGAIDEATVGSLGRVLGASRLMFGSINRMGGNVVISGRIVNSETGEIIISATENGNESEINENVQRLVRALIREDRSKYQAYLRSMTYKNSLRIKTDFSAFFGQTLFMQNDDKNYDISYRRKGIPFFVTDNWYTELEAGSYVCYGAGQRRTDSRYAVTNEIRDNPYSINIQYYLPIPFLESIYLKAGGGAAYRVLRQSYWPNNVGYSVLVTEEKTSWRPIGKIGLGADIVRIGPISFHFEGMYNHFSTISDDPKEPNRVTLNIGTALNW